jgi:hypothetical protein
MCVWVHLQALALMQDLLSETIIFMRQMDKVL